MRIDTTNIPTNPFHIARAYGAAPAQRPQPIAPAGEVQTTRPGAAARPPGAVGSLVAGVVPGGVSFKEDGSTAQPSAPAIQMYRHPADKNAAATAVQVGRRLDVQG